jgi:hypothetical protein
MGQFVVAEIDDKHRETLVGLLEREGYGLLIPEGPLTLDIVSQAGGVYALRFSRGQGTALKLRSDASMLNLRVNLWLR